MDFEQALERVTQELAKEGFGLLSDIDVAATLKKKLGMEMPAYRILGACNPQFAHRALEAEPENQHAAALQRRRSQGGR